MQFSSHKDIWEFINNLYEEDVRLKGNMMFITAQKHLIACAIYILLLECPDSDRNVRNIIELIKFDRIKKSDYDHKSILDVIVNQIREKDSDNSAVLHYDILKSCCIMDESIIFDASAACITKLLSLINYEAYMNEVIPEPEYITPRQSSAEKLRQLRSETISDEIIRSYDVKNITNNVFDNSDIDKFMGINLDEPFSCSINSPIKSHNDVWEIGFPHGEDIIAHIERVEEDVILKLTGKGKTKDFNLNNRGWLSDYSLEITKVIVGEKIISLGKGIFENLNGLKEVVIGSDVTTINDFAFRNCKMLEKVNFVENANKSDIPGTIGEKCFEECMNLKEIVLPDRFVNIGYGCFIDCINLKQVACGKDTYLYSKEYMFDQCSSLENVEIFVLEECIKTVPEYILTFVRNNGYDIVKAAPLDEKVCTGRYKNRYYILDKTIYLSPYLNQELADDLIEEIIAETVYSIFTSKNVKYKELFRDTYLKFRFDIYQSFVSKEMISTNEANSIMRNDATCFCYFFTEMFSYKKAPSYPPSMYNLYDYKEFIEHICDLIKVENISLHLPEVINELLGDEREKHLTYGILSKAFKDKKQINIPASNVKYWIIYLIEEKLINAKERPGGGYIFYPSKQENFSLVDKEKTDEKETAK